MWAAKAKCGPQNTEAKFEGKHVNTAVSRAAQSNTAVSLFKPGGVQSKSGNPE